MSLQSLVYFTLLLLIPSLTHASEPFDLCMKNAIKKVSDETTVGSLRKKCLGLAEKARQTEVIENEAVIKEKKEIESIAQSLPFLLVPHNSNYVLPGTYNFSLDGTESKREGFELDEAEVKFQLSIKARLADDVFGDDGDIWFAYTNLSFWQAYNSGNSSPFRETNHEPEVFIDFSPELSFLNSENSLLRFGAVHQSNGRSGLQSRSWNRVYGLLTLESGNWFWSIKPWFRIPESEKEDPLDSRGDDNPDIDRFLGYGDLFAMYRGSKHHASLLFRNNLRTDNKIGLELGWSYPIASKVRAYVQYFNGYGESLIDYNDHVSRLGIGFQFSEPL